MAHGRMSGSGLSARLSRMLQNTSVKLNVGTPIYTTFRCLPGIVDDVHGANFVQGTKSGDPYDDNGHGTFVAGVVGAVGNNGIGTIGISEVASIIGAHQIVSLLTTKNGAAEASGQAVAVAHCNSCKFAITCPFKIQWGGCSYISPAVVLTCKGCINCLNN